MKLRNLLNILKQVKDDPSVLDYIQDGKIYNLDTYTPSEKEEREEEEEENYEDDSESSCFDDTNDEEEGDTGGDGESKYSAFSQWEVQACLRNSNTTLHVQLRKKGSTSYRKYDISVSNDSLVAAVLSAIASGEYRTSFAGSSTKYAILKFDSASNLSGWARFRITLSTIKVDIPISLFE